MKRQLLITLITAAVELLLRVAVLKKRAAKLLLVLVLACALPAQAGQFLPFSGPLTGGTTGALDALYAGGYTAGGTTYYSSLATGDIAIHSYGGVSGIYRFVVASAPQAESPPTVIVPDYQSQGVPYTGNGAWILTSARSDGSFAESPLTLRASQTPVSPSAGYHKLYIKSNGRAYTLNSSGVETDIGEYTLTGAALDSIFPLTGIMKHSGPGSYGIALQGTDYYAPGGVDVSLADGGTGASLADPGANRLWGWDDTDGGIRFITIGANLSYDHSTHTLSAVGGEGGSSTFDSLITGTNTTATMTVGTGGTLTYTGTGIVNASQYQGVTSISATEFGYLDGVTGALQGQLNAKAAASHTHSGSDITTGTIPIGVLPTGTTASSVALGNHTHTGVYAEASHYHSGSDITSGTVGPAYLPANSYSSAGIVTAGGSYANMVWKTDASGNPGWRADATGGGSGTFDGIGTGTNTSATMTVGTGGTLTYSGSGIVNASRYQGVTTVDATEFGYLNGVTSAIQTQLNAKAASSHTHAAADVTSGVFDNARVNWAAPGAIGGTTPAAGAFTTLSAGAAGFTVDADGDVTAKSLTIAKASGTAGTMRAYEANSTDTSTVGWMGPASISASWDYQFSSTQPAANSIMLFGAPSSNISAQTWATLDDTGTNGDTAKIWSADKCYDQDALRLALSGGTLTGALITAAPSTGGAGLNLPHGTAPTSPVNGDLWTTTSGLYARINGSTVGPFGTGGGGLSGSGIAGHMAYWSSASGLTYDSDGSFYWDATNNRLGIGTTIPTQALELGASKWLSFEGATANAYETTFDVIDPTADRTITAPDASGTLVLHSAAQTLTNKTLSTGTVIPITIGIACSDESTALTTGTAKATFRMPHAMTLTAVRASVGTAPVGSTIIVDINEGGSTIMTTNKLSIDASEKTSTTAATAAGITDSTLADDAEITIDIDQIGSSTAGAGLKVWLIGTRTL